MQQQLAPPDVPVGDRRSVRIGNRRLNVWIAGTRGPVVVLIHGLPSNYLPLAQLGPDRAGSPVALDAGSPGGRDLGVQDPFLRPTYGEPLLARRSPG
jgi:hypothetical protein